MILVFVASAANSLRSLRETFNTLMVVIKIWHLQKGNDIKKGSRPLLTSR
jgi:hypothetical protein